MFAHYGRQYRKAGINAFIILISFVGLSNQAQAIPATADAELAALSVSDSDMETDLAAEEFYERLKIAAQKACNVGRLVFGDTDHQSSTACAIDTVHYFVNIIGNPRLKVIFERDTRKSRDIGLQYASNTLPKIIESHENVTCDMCRNVLLNNNKREMLM